MELQLEDFSLDDLQEFMQTEQYEQLDELSKTTLGNYIKKSADDKEYNARAFDRNREKGEYDSGALNKTQKRKKGIAAAVKKLTETEEQLEEASKHFEAGQWAVLKGKKYSDNPHPAGSKEHSEWSKGHNDMRAKRANESLDETLEHDHIQQTLADKDINSKIHQGKVQVHKSNVAKAKAHVAKLGHKIEVIGGLNEDISEYSLEELEEFLVSEDGQLDELSKTTLGNYIKKASKNASNVSMHLGLHRYPQASHEYRKELMQQVDKREDGIAKAVKKLTEDEQLDELSKTTLGNYIRKSSTDVANKSAEAADVYNKSTDRADRYKNVTKRLKGINKAVKKLTENEIIRESIEDLINNIRAGKTSDAISKFEDLAKVKSMEEIEQLKSAMRQRIYNNYAGVPAETDDSDD